VSEEQKLILDMLSEGKISVEEAQTLLESLGKEETKTDKEAYGQSERPSIMDGIIDTIRSGLSSVNFAFGDGAKIVLEERHSGRFNTDNVDLELAVRNGSLRIQTWDEDEFRLDIIKKVMAGTREQAEELVSGFRFAEIDGSLLRAGDQECRNLGNRINVSLRLWLPRQHRYSGKLESRNGSIEVTGVDSKGMDIHTVNGSLKCNKVSGERVEARTVNGSLSLEGNLGGVKARTTNGSITMTNIAEDSKCELETVNGRIRVYLPVRSGIGLAVDARTKSGSVGLEHPSLVTMFSQRGMAGGRSVEARTENWKEAGNKIELHLRSVNGSIRIQELE